MTTPPAEAVAEVEPRQASMAVWAVPTTVTAGKRFTVVVGVRSAAATPLARQAIAVCASDDRILAMAELGEAPWPETDALYYAEMSLRAPDTPGRVTLTARFDPSGLDEAHDAAAAPFDVVVVATAEHALTVTVTADGVPLEEAYLRLGPYRAVTDADGRAVIKLAAGRYDLQVWKAGYDIADAPVVIAADTEVAVAARPSPEPDGDAHWTA